MFFWNSLAFSMIQLMLAIWSLVPLPFLKPCPAQSSHTWYNLSSLYKDPAPLASIWSNSEGRRQWHPTPVLLPGKSHGWRSLVGCSPWGCKESDMTERLHFDFSLSCIGEGNANPLQCSCLENPRDGGAWWAAVYGVTQSRTQLKWLSSSSSIALAFKAIWLDENYQEVAEAREETFNDWTPRKTDDKQGGKLPVGKFYMCIFRIEHSHLLSSQVVSNSE